MSGERRFFRRDRLTGHIAIGVVGVLCAAAVVFEAAEVAKERGSRVLAEVTASLAWRDGEEAPLAALASAPSTAACVVVPRAHDERVSALLDGTPWQDVPRLACDGAGGEHEALGAIAISAATSEIARGNVKDALVLGLEKGRGYAVRLESRL